jgi:hypothetical protein
MPTQAPPSDATLVRYLLGTLPHGDEERFDELSVVDPRFAERLRAIEHDLADAYARGELSQPDRQRWERRFLSSPQGRDDLRLAEALAARERRGPVRRPSLPWTWGLAAAASLAAIATVTSYLIVQRRAMPPAPSSATVAPERRPDIQRTAPEKPNAPSAEPRFVALTLAPALRSLAEPPRLVIPAGTTEVRLTLRLEPNEYSRYDVSIGDVASHEDIWMVAGIDALRTPDGKVLNAVVPASALRSGRYLVTVRAGRQREIIESYPLSIVLQ